MLAAEVQMIFCHHDLPTLHRGSCNQSCDFSWRSSSSSSTSSSSIQHHLTGGRMLNILLGCIHVKSWQPPILPPCTSQNWCCAKRSQSLVKCLIIDIQSPGTTGRCRGENQGKFILRLNCNGSAQQQLCWSSRNSSIKLTKWLQSDKCCSS